MNIKELKIKGYKSIGEITLRSPNPFTVFVGANGAGKSNIFEALEFLNYCNVMDDSEVVKFFGGIDDILNKNRISKSELEFNIDLGKIKPSVTLRLLDTDANTFGSGTLIDFGKYFNERFQNQKHFKEKFIEETLNRSEYLQFTNFCRLFIGKENKIKRTDDSQLALDGSNLEKVLKRIFREPLVKSEIIEILQILVPEFENIDVVSEELSGTDNLVIYEKTIKKPLTKRLISDGTYNILAILAAIYQSDTPQFLCIEEPENGLNPKVVRELVNIIRTQCAEKGHYIWLNTHSQTLVSELRPEEIILVDKVNGMTQTKQVNGMNLHGLKMDEALLTNSLGGGIPW